MSARLVALLAWLLTAGSAEALGWSLEQVQAPSDGDRRGQYEITLALTDAKDAVLRAQVYVASPKTIGEWTRDRSRIQPGFK